jgi:iron complex outermembrane receptor protein
VKGESIIKFYFATIVHIIEQKNLTPAASLGWANESGCNRSKATEGGNVMIEIGPRHSVSLCLSVSCSVLLTTLSIVDVRAQDSEARPLLEEVTVTARRREESNQRVPVAITSVSGDALQNASVQRVEELRFVAPSLQVSPTPFGNAVPGYTIRGQRQLESLATQDPSVVVYFADVPMMRPHATNGAFFDIDSVQVLKGPQGTLFGRNTTGGAVLINPKRPTHDFGGEIAVGFGNYGEVNGTGVLNVPAGDTLSIRAAGTIRQSDGYTRNLVNGKMLDEDDNWAARLGVLWSPTESLDIYTVFQKIRFDAAASGWRLLAVNPAGAYSTFPGVTAQLQQTLATLQNSSWHTVANDAGITEQADSWSLSNTITWNVRGVTLKNIAGYRDVETFARFDYDGSAVTVTGAGTGPVSLFNSQNTLDGYQWSEEFQVLGTALADNLDWIVGAFWFKEDNYDDQRSDLFGRRANVGTGINESRSLFAQGSYKIAAVEGLSVTAGYRHSWDDRELISQNQIQALTQPALACRLRNTDGTIPDPCRRVSKLDGDEPTYTLGVDYQLTGQTLLYLTYRHGYRSGGLQLRANLETERPTFDPETVDDYELGLKTTFGVGDGQLRINTALFNSDYKDIQRTLSYIPTGAQALSTAVLNAANATIRGGEVEVAYAPTDRLEISGFYSYTDASYDSFAPPGSITLPIPGRALKDNKFAMLPKTTASARVRYTQPLADAGALSAQLSWYRQDEFEMTDINDPNGRIPAYSLMNAALDWRDVMGKTIDLRAYVKNLTDEEYGTGGTSVWTTGFVTTLLGPPRTYGFEMRYRFGE